MIIKHPRLIIKQHGTIKSYRYVGDVSASPSLIPARPWVGKWQKQNFWCGMLPNMSYHISFFVAWTFGLVYCSKQ